MPKIKTLRAASKRFKKISSKKFKYKHAYTRHILTKKTTKCKRHLRHKPIIKKKFLTSFVRSLTYL